MREKIVNMLKSTERNNIGALITAIDTMGFFTAPCSGGNHLCKDGGLAEHSFNVMTVALKLAETLGYEETNSVIIASLLHDLGKIGDYGKPMYIDNVLKSGKRSEAKPFKRNKALIDVPHAIRSVKLATMFIDLTEDEEWAILTHDGLYDFMKYEIPSKETQLSLIVHWADLWCTRVIEAENEESEE